MARADRLRHISQGGPPVRDWCPHCNGLPGVEEVDLGWNEDHDEAQLQGMYQLSAALSAVRQLLCTLRAVVGRREIARRAG